MTPTLQLVEAAEPGTPMIQTHNGVPHDHSQVLCLAALSEGRSTWHLRHDVRRVLLYEKDHVRTNVSRAMVLHPTEAVILALFDGTRTLGDIEATIARLFGVRAEAACGQIAGVIRRYREALHQTSLTTVPRHGYRPETFLIPAHQVDCETHKTYKPLVLVFRLSDDCMRDCIYCDVEKRRLPESAVLSRHRWLELVDECLMLDVPAVSLSGGDPFMNRDVVDIIAALVSGGIQPLVPTKSHITRSLAERIAGAGLKRMQVSIDAPLPGLADLMTASRGFFAAATDTIRNLRAVGLGVRTNCVMTHINVRKAAELIEFLLGMGVDDISITAVGRSPYIASDLNDVLFLDQADVEWLKELSARYAQQNVTVQEPEDLAGMPVAAKWKTFVRRSRCTAGAWGFIVHCDGKVTLCDEMPTDDFNVVGNVSHQSLMDVWKSPRIKDLVEPPVEKFLGTACYECVDFTDCHANKGRCFRDAWKAYGSYYMPMPDCPLAPAAPRMF